MFNLNLRRAVSNVLFRLLGISKEMEIANFDLMKIIINSYTRTYVPGNLDSSVLKKSDRIIVTYKDITSDAFKGMEIRSKFSNCVRETVKSNVMENLQAKFIKRRRLEESEAINEITNGIFMESLGMEVIPCETTTCSVLVEAFTEQSLVEDVNLDDIMYGQAELSKAPFNEAYQLPQDKYLNRQWYLGSKRGIAAEGSWDHGVYNSSRRDILVAVIDSGVQFDHPDLQGRIYKNPLESCGDGVDNDGNGFIDDCYGWNFIHHNNSPEDDVGHGTAAVGLIAANTNNGVGVSSLCPDCVILPIKALDKNLNGKVSDFVMGINYGVKMGAVISNNSYGATYGGRNPFPALKQAIERSKHAGMLFVAAAGNYRNNNDTIPLYPATFNNDNIISVAASTEAGTLADFSNYGLRTVHVAAPGDRIWGLDIKGTYSHHDGTSFSAPIVSGMAGYLLSKYPQLNIWDVRDAIILSAENKGLPIRSGGVVNMALAEKLALEYSKKRGFDDPCSGEPCAKNDMDTYRIVCVPSGSTYECRCRSGYEKANGDCVDIDECDRLKDCPDSSTCINLPGTFECICPEGEFWSTGDNKCKRSQYQCTSMDVSRKCGVTCRPGYQRNRQDANRCVRAGIFEFLPPHVYDAMMLTQQ